MGAEPVKGCLLIGSGFCLNGWLVDPGFGWWAGCPGWSVSEPVGVRLVGGIEHGLVGGSVVDVGGV